MPNGSVTRPKKSFRRRNVKKQCTPRQSKKKKSILSVSSKHAVGSFRSLHPLWKYDLNIAKEEWETWAAASGQNNSHELKRGANNVVGKRLLKKGVKGLLSSRLETTTTTEE